MVHCAHCIHTHSQYSFSVSFCFSAHSFRLSDFRIDRSYEHRAYNSLPLSHTLFFWHSSLADKLHLPVSFAMCIGICPTDYMTLPFTCCSEIKFNFNRQAIARSTHRVTFHHINKKKRFIADSIATANKFYLFLWIMINCSFILAKC